MGVFHPICPLPPQNISFVLSPNIRSTADIFSTCLVILVLCTWSVLHLNVPVQVQIVPDSGSLRLKKIVYLLLRKIKWMVFALLAPEVLLGAAFADLLSAMTSKSDMKACAAEDGVSWSLVHGFLANMGGFVVQFDHAEVQTLTQTPHPAQQDVEFEGHPKNKSSNLPSEAPLNETVCKNQGENDQIGFHPVVPFPGLRLDEEIIMSETGSPTELSFVSIPSPAEAKTFSSFDLIWENNRLKRQLDPWLGLSALAQQNISQPWNIGPSMSWRRDNRNADIVKQALARLKPSPLAFIIPLYLNLATLQGNVWILDARQLYYARKWGLITLPDVSEEAIDEKSKGDALVKVIAVFEIIWLIVQLVTRHIRGHPSAQLEIMTLAFAVCSFVTYSLSLKKPQDIRLPISVRANRYPYPNEVLTLANFGPVVWFDAIVFGWTSGRTKYWIPNTACHYVSHKSWGGIQWRRYGAFWFGSAIGAFILGALHALAWNSEFPTAIEKTTWRIASILTIAIPWGYLILGNIFLGFLLLLTNRSSNGGNRMHSSSNPFSYFSEVIMGFPKSFRVAINMYYSSLSLIALLGYSLARLFVLVEVVRSLAFLPPAAFVSTWVH